MAHGGSIAGLMAKWSEHNGDGLEVEVISSLALPDFGKPQKSDVKTRVNIGKL